MSEKINDMKKVDIQKNNANKKAVLVYIFRRKNHKIIWNNEAAKW